MAQEFRNPKPIIDPTESVASAQQKLDLWTRRGMPLRVIVEDTAGNLKISAWDLLSASPADEALGEVFVMAGAAAQTISLPSVADNVGRLVWIKNRSVGVVTITPDGSDTIEDAADADLAIDASFTLLAVSSTATGDQWLTI